MSSASAGVSTARVNGITMAYRRWPGSPRGTCPPVVLLHGLLQTGEGMAHLADLLCQNGEVLAPDLRGRGGTEQPGAGYDPATMADDVAALLDHLGLGRVVVIGRLHGGLVAYHLAARRPDLVRGLVLGDTTPEVNAERAASMQKGIAALPTDFPSREDAVRFYEETLRLSPARARHDLPSDLEETASGRYQWRHNLDVIAEILRESMPRSDWDVLADVRCPVLILHGQRGFIGPDTVGRMVETMPGSRAHMIYSAGYDVFLGPGSEQSLAAMQLFLRGFGDEEGERRPDPNRAQ